MNTLRRSLCLALTSLALSSLARAELVYQPPPPPSGAELDQDWRRAGSQLFLGAASLNEALSDLELRRGEAALDKLRRAEGLLKEAMSTYAKIAGALSRPRVVALEKLSDAERARLDQMQRGYGVKLPANEAEAAQLAMSETQRLLDSLGNHRSGLLKPDLAAVREVLGDLTRLQRIGMQTAIMMTTVREPR